MAKKYKRSANGSGTVAHLSGNRRKPWRAMAPAVEDEMGNYTRETIGYFETRQEALDAIALHRLCPAVVDSNVTLKDLFLSWKETAYRNISKSSVEGYNAAWNRLKPLYQFKVTDIKTPQYQYCIDQMEGSSWSSIHKVKVLAGRLEEYAVQLDIKTKNYAEFVTLPKKEDEEKVIFTDFDLQRIEKGANEGVGVADLILIMCYTGWRIAEFCELTVFDWDRENNTLQGGLKTDAGRNRIVPIPQKVQGLVESCFEKGKGKLCPHRPKWLRAQFYATLEALGIANEDKKITPHSTRHTYNSMLFKQGVDVDTRMKLMGQSDASTNRNVYTHADIEHLSEAVSKIG